MILVILTSYVPHYSNKNHIGKYIKVIRCNFDAKSKYEHNGSLHVHWMLRLLNFFSFHVHWVWFHCKICNLWSVACCHMYCCRDCISAWFCEANVKTFYCWWDITFFLSSQGSGRFVFNSAHVINFLKNVSLIVYNEVKLILASSSIVITLILDK
jgi:hypothetical protein